MAEGFGIFVGIPGNNQFTYDNSFDSFNLCRMYQAGLIDPKTLLMNYPEKEMMPFGTSDRICRELDLQWFEYPEDRALYLSIYKDQCKSFGSILMDPLVTEMNGGGVK